MRRSAFGSPFSALSDGATAMFPQGIEKLHVRGFRAFRDACVEFTPCNVLIGANGAGKSALLSLLKMMRALSYGELQVFVGKAGGAGEVLHRSAPATETLEVDMTLRTSTGFSRYALLAERTEDDGLLIRQERIERTDPDGQPRGSEVLAKPTRESPMGEPIRWGSEHRLFAGFRAYHFVDTTPAAAVRQEWDLHDNQQLRGDGANLAAFLHLLQQRYPNVYRLIESTVRLVFAEFAGFSLSPSALNPDRIRLRWRRKGGEGDLAANQLSDGTLRFMLLAAVLMQPHELLPPIIGIDEPELGLHPAALEMVTGLIQSASRRAQLIVATQSAPLIDAFEPQDVVVTHRRETSSTFERLKAEQLAEWLEEYSLGELWEKNVVGGGPLG